MFFLSVRLNKCQMFFIFQKPKNIMQVFFFKLKYLSFSSLCDSHFIQFINAVGKFYEEKKKIKVWSSVRSKIRTYYICSFTQQMYINVYICKNVKLVPIFFLLFSNEINSKESVHLLFLSK